MLVKMLMLDLEMEDLLLPMLLARTMYQNSEQGKMLLVDKLHMLLDMLLGMLLQELLMLVLLLMMLDQDQNQEHNRSSKANFI
jgi:hypothetical protein